MSEQQQQEQQQQQQQEEVGASQHWQQGVDDDVDDDGMHEMEVSGAAGSVLQKVRQQRLQETYEDLLDTVTFKCFDECVSPIGYKLTSAHKDCLDACMESFSTRQSIIVASLQQMK